MWHFISLRKRVAGEYLIGHEGNESGYRGNIEGVLLGINSAHPMHQDAVGEYVIRAGADWNLITIFMKGGSLREVKYQGEIFCLRRSRARPEYFLDPIYPLFWSLDT